MGAPGPGGRRVLEVWLEGKERERAGGVGKAQEMEPRQTGHRSLEVTTAWKRAAEAWRRPR